MKVKLITIIVFAVLSVVSAFGAGMLATGWSTHGPLAYQHDGIYMLEGSGALIVVGDSSVHVKKEGEICTIKILPDGPSVEDWCSVLDRPL